MMYTDDLFPVIKRHVPHIAKTFPLIVGPPSRLVLATRPTTKGDDADEPKQASQ